MAKSRKLKFPLDRVRKRIVDLAAEQVRSKSDLSRSVKGYGKKNEAWLWQYLFRYEKQELEGEDRFKLARELGVDETVLMNDRQLKTRGLPGLSDAPQSVYETESPPEQFPMHIRGRRDLPVYGHIEAGQDILMLNDDVIDYADRPPQLENVDNAFGLYVHGSSMEPRYFPRELLHVHPGIPPKAGDFVVVKLNDGEALVKQLVKMDKKSIVLNQFNPNRRRTLPTSKVICVQVIVGTGRPR